MAGKQKIFSVSKAFYIIYANTVPVGYAVADSEFSLRISLNKNIKNNAIPENQTFDVGVHLHVVQGIQNLYMYINTGNLRYTQRRIQNFERMGVLL